MFQDFCQRLYIVFHTYRIVNWHNVRIYCNKVACRSAFILINEQQGNSQRRGVVGRDSMGGTVYYQNQISFPAHPPKTPLSQPGLWEFMFVEEDVNLIIIYSKVDNW